MVHTIDSINLGMELIENPQVYSSSHSRKVGKAIFQVTSHSDHVLFKHFVCRLTLQSHTLGRSLSGKIMMLIKKMNLGFIYVHSHLHTVILLQVRVYRNLIFFNTLYIINIHCEGIEK